MPFVVFAQWPVEAIYRRKPELLAFPVVQLLEEAAHDLGFAKGWIRLRRRYGRRREVATPDS